MAMAGTRIVVGRSVSFAVMAVSQPFTTANSIVAPLLRISASVSCLSSLSRDSSSSSSSSFSCQGFCRRRSLHSSVVSCPSSPASVQEGAGPSSPPEKAAHSVTQAEIDALDIRVGRVLKAWKHPEADSLYVEEVDLAEAEGPRTICSGLVKYMSVEELEGRNVVVLANLKPRNMRGVKSNGMLLAASNEEHTTVQLLFPPDGAVPGERVWFGTETDRPEQGAALTPNQLAKKKVWEGVQPFLRTTEECVAECQSKPMRTSVGVVRCESLQGASIA